MGLSFYDVVSLEANTGLHFCKQTWIQEILQRKNGFEFWWCCMPWKQMLNNWVGIECLISFCINEPTLREWSVSEGRFYTCSLLMAVGGILGTAAGKLQWFGIYLCPPSPWPVSNLRDTVSVMAKLPNPASSLSIILHCVICAYGDHGG